MTYQVVKGKAQAPWAVMIYGPPGIGKSTWASEAPRPFFLDLEDGLARIGPDRSPVVSSMEELAKSVQFAAASDYTTIVFDTADALEKLLTTHVCEKHKKDSLGDFGYGKGEVNLRAEWAKMINVVLRLKLKGKNVIMTAHEMIKTHDDPSTDSYDRYILNLEKKAAPAIVAAMDAVFFARYETIVTARDEDKKGSKNRAVGTGKRVLQTTETPAWIAKNRFGLPPTIPMTAAVFAKLNPTNEPAKAANEE